MKILSIDVGIKNLAFCLFEKSNDTQQFKITKWDIINLSEERSLKCGFIEKSLLCNKQAKFKKIIMRCVQCDKPGGTIFDERNGLLKAVCGSKTPCDLNINIKRKLYDNVREVEQKNLKKSEGLKMRIIMTKLDYLFGLNSSKEEIVDKFNTLKNELAQLSESQLIIQKKYGDIMTGVHREPLLADANLELINEIAELKKIYEEYLTEPSTAYLETMVEKYLTIIKPLTVLVISLRVI